ncbi:MAG: Electron transfer flavoprotein-ubiquinone oxidoreductase [Chloroflexi bacterium ADurb.Bin360]|nr:MAG: Electron transfer flavoprotein-ubiquinone oxidoreductase [Chloroflexi bacterium ADurb.Bin360]
MNTRDERISFDVIVVGAGLAGPAAAMVAARAGLNVALVERGQKPGSKNYFGGAIYTHAIEELIPDFMSRRPPFERPVTEAGFWFLSEDGLTRMTVQGGKLANQPADAYTTLRAPFDLWWTEQAQKDGVFLIPKTTVVDFIREADGQVIGVKTDRPQGDIYAPVVIICEGVNNILTQKLGLIEHDLEPAHLALGVKQVVALPPETINARFGLPDNDHGLAVSVLGDVSLGLPGMGFVYTNSKTLSVGLGVMLSTLSEYKLKPYEVLQRYLQHPAIAPLVAGGQLLEYGGHLIPEGGYRDMPKLYTGGALVAGDAAAMVNALHWEGTNMAIIAGKLAGETAIEAHGRGDFSNKVMVGYEERLKASFILPDLKQYRGFSHFLDTHPEFMGTYPAFLNDALGDFFSAYGRPKMQLFKGMLGSLTERRSLPRAAGDIISMGRAVLGW